MRAAFALRIISGRIIFISRLSRSAERSKRIFTGGGRNGKRQLRGENPLRLTAFASSPEGGAFGYLAVSTDKAPPFGGAGTA